MAGFTKAIRYTATDGKQPGYLAYYEMTSPDIAFGAEYKALNANATARDKDIVSRTDCLNRRVYDYISDVTISGSTFPTKFALVVTFLVQPELEDEFNKWYEEEHIPQLSRVPGYHRARRYKLVDSGDLGRKPFAGPIHNYLALYDTDRDDWMEVPEFKAPMQTPTTVKMLATATAWEARRFALHKELEPPK